MTDPDKIQNFFESRAGNLCDYCAYSLLSKVISKCTYFPRALTTDANLNGAVYKFRISAMHYLDDGQSIQIFRAKVPDSPVRLPSK